MPTTADEQTRTTGHAAPAEFPPVAGDRRNAQPFDLVEAEGVLGR
jgi:hypothetical protein